MFRRTIFSDVVQGIIIGCVLAFITAQIIMNAYVTTVNGWTTIFGCGEPGNGMLSKAACANKFPAVNVPQEAMYWTRSVDGAGQKLSGQHNYTMHFPAGGLPPNNGSNLMTTGVNRDTLLTVGWLCLSKGPQVLHVPDMAGRYYSVQFTDRSNGTDFAYVGTRTTGRQAGDYLITGQGWQGTVPSGMTQISSPNKSVLVIGRVLVYSDSDLPTAYGLAKLIQLAPLSSN